MSTAEIIVAVVEIYTGFGLLFSIWFVTRGVTIVDESASGSGVLFRLLLIPGTTVFWPLLAKRCVKR